jgi:peptidyl-prolyl cis-trans isomerase A (cyclophilin A)
MLSRRAFLFFLGILTLTYFQSCQNKVKYDRPLVVIETKYGDIFVELFTQEAPLTAGAFLRYADSGVYKNGSFYRVLRYGNQITGAPKSNLIQGGIWYTNPKLQQSIPGIPHESTAETGILHEHGTVSMARAKPGTATTEFFICVGEQKGFNHGGKNNEDGLGYAAFGKVIKGMEVVLKMYAEPERNQQFKPHLDILNVRRVQGLPKE